jgi:hypothetical protein
MAAIPIWWTSGNGPFTVSITPQTIASDGTLSDGTLVALTGSIDDVEFGNDPTNENIKPMSTRRANFVGIEESPRVTLVEILKSSGVNILSAANYTSDVFKVIIVRGAQTITYYGRRAAYSERMMNGKSTSRLSFDPVDIGTANPTVV